MREICKSGSVGAPEERSSGATRRGELEPTSADSSAASDSPRSRKKRRTGPDGTPQSQRNFTDPDSRILETADGFIQGYDGQSAVDATSQVIVAHMLRAEQNDAPVLIPTLDRIKANVGRQAAELSADAGYCSEHNLFALARRGNRGYVATGRQHHGERRRMKRQPGLGRQTRKMRRRIASGGFRSRYRLRKQVVDPVFGQIKSALGFWRVLLRRARNVAHEVALVCTAHNLRNLVLGGRRSPSALCITS